MTPLYAPPFFNTANPLEHAASLNDFGAETDFGFEEPALSTYGATGAHAGATAMGRDSESTAPDPLTRGQKKNIKTRAKRLESRKRKQEATGTSLKACSLRHRSAAMALKLTPQHNLEEKLLSQPAWVAKREDKRDSQNWAVYGHEELVDDFGMTSIDWDGRYVYIVTIGVPAAYEQCLGKQGHCLTAMDAYLGCLGEYPRLQTGIMSKRLLHWALKRPGPNLPCHKSTSTIDVVTFQPLQLGYLMVVGNYILGFSTMENTTHPF